MQPATQAWWFAAGRLLGTVLIGLGAGWLFGNPWGGLACALAAAPLVGSWRSCFGSSGGCATAATPIRPMSAVCGARSSRRSCACIGASASTSSASYSSCASCSAPPRRCPNGVVILNAQREIVWFNRMAGAAAEPAPHRRPRACVSRTCCAARVRALPRRRRTTPTRSSCAPTTGEDGFLSLQVAPYGDGQLLLLVRDVSRQMRLEAVRRDFVANASHELRSPLTVISRVSGDPGAGPGARSGAQAPVAEMRRQAERMTAIIRDLLELSRLEETDEIVGGEPVDVVALARRCCARTCWRAPRIRTRCACGSIRTRS